MGNRPYGFNPAAVPVVLCVDGRLYAGVSSATRNSPFDLQLVKENQAHQDTVFGLRLMVPEDLSIPRTKSYDLVLEFPPGSTKLSISAPAEAELKSANGMENFENCISITIEIDDTTAVYVKGYGLPYNGNHKAAEGIIAGTDPIAGSLLLADFCTLRKFQLFSKDKFLLRELLASGLHTAAYPFDDRPHPDFTEKTVATLLKEVNSEPGGTFKRANSFQDPVALWQVLSQSVVQEFIHLYSDTKRIQQKVMPCHVVHCDEDGYDGKFKVFSIIVYMKDLVSNFRQGSIRHSWSRLVQQDKEVDVQISRPGHSPFEKPLNFTTLVKSETSPLKDRLGEFDLILVAKLPRRHMAKQLAFVDIIDIGTSGSESRGTLKFVFPTDFLQSKRKYQAVASLLPDAPLRPLPFVDDQSSARAMIDECRQDARALERDVMSSLSEASLSVSPTEVHLLETRREFNREFWLGEGFWNSRMRTLQDVEHPSTKAEDALPGSLEVQGVDKSKGFSPHPPVIDLLGTGNETLQSIILDRVFPDYRARVAQYMRATLLGIGVITGFGGSGKSNVLAATVLCMLVNDKIGAVYAAACTNIGVDHLAVSLDKMSREVVEEHNGSCSDGNVMRHFLIVRGCRWQLEKSAFFDATFNPGLDQSKFRKKIEDGQISAHLTIAAWLLKIFQTDPNDLHPEDPEVIQELCREVQYDEGLADLRHRANGKRSLEANDRETSEEQELVEDLMCRLVLGADSLCTTPSLSANPTYDAFNRLRAKAVAFDGANTLSRPECILLWGNTGRPCIMAGDNKQLRPTVVSIQESSDHYHTYNRFAEEGEVSALSWAISIGWKVLQLDKQLRAANGFQDAVLRRYYDIQHVETTYHDSMRPENFTRCHEIEAWLRDKKQLPATGTSMGPVFIHCNGTFPQSAPDSLSLLNVGQVDIVISFLKSLVEDLPHVAGEIAVLTPYRGNISRLQKEIGKAAALKDIRYFTADEFQGQEAEIVVYIFTITTQAHAAFAADERRLCTAMTRARSALFLIGTLALSKEGGVYMSKMNTYDGERLESVDSVNHDVVNVISESKITGRLLRYDFKVQKKSDIRPPPADRGARGGRGRRGRHGGRFGRFGV